MIKKAKKSNSKNLQISTGVLVLENKKIFKGVGIGYQGENIGLSTGVRIFPSYVYGQIHAKTNKGQVSFSFEKSPFSDANFEIGPSFGTSHIFTIGYQWHIGKSRALNRG